MTHHPRGAELTLVVEWQNGGVRRVPDTLAGEEPLEIRVGRSPLAVIMRTPGDDRELAAGFLFTEGLIESREQIRSLEDGAGSKPSDRGNVVKVKLASSVKIDRRRARRDFLATSSCGVCGKASIDSVHVRKMRPLNPKFELACEVLCRLPETLRKAQSLFGKTGGLHAAALFDARGELAVVREDIGRHNAVDKVIGWALLGGHVPLSESGLLVSGRGGFEIVQKAIVAGVPMVASVSAPSSLAVRLSREMGLTLVGFLRGQRFVVYAGEQRLGIGAEGKASLGP